MCGLSPPPPQHAVQALVGRDDELDLIRIFLSEMATHGSALLLTGEPGVGKSALLDAAAQLATASGNQVLRATGAELEAEASYSGLDQLLMPLQASVGHLSTTHRGRLSVALNLGEDGPPTEHLILCNATLDLLCRTAVARPVLVIVDDLQWLDRASALVVALVARRVAGGRVGFLASTTPGAESPLTRARLPELRLQPLKEPSAARLLRMRFPTLAARVHRRVLADAQGNPLALTELPTALTPRQRTGLHPLPQVLPINRRLRGMFVSAVEVLPEATRALLLLAALEGSGDLSVLEAATGSTSGLDHLGPSELSRLVSVHEDSSRLTFRHPMVRSTVVELSTRAERRLAHLALAEALAAQPDRRAWHLAEATAQQRDEKVAALLETSFGSNLERGDAVGAVTALTRAAELSPQGADRARRLAEAAYINADVTGQLTIASHYLADANQAQPQSTESPQAAVAGAYLLLNAECDIESAHRLVVGAILAHGDHYDAGDETLMGALHCLLTICWFGGRPELWQPFDDALSRITPEVPSLLALCATTFGDPVHHAASRLAELTALTSLRDEFNPIQITRTATACLYVDRLGECREALWRVIRDGRGGGAVALAINALVFSCVDDWLTGQWDEALNLAAEGVAVSEEHGYRRYSIILGGYLRALIQVVRGNAKDGLASADDMARWAEPRGVGVALTFAHHVHALAALASEDFEGAYRHASAISPAGALSPHNPHALWVMLDLVEASVKTNRRAEARAHVTAMRDSGIAAISPRLALIATGSAAIAATGDEAAKLYEDAVAIPGADRWPFELARVQLAYGEHLRRSRAVVEARSHLKAAMDIFDRLGARPWTKRASTEIRAAGLPTTRWDDDTAARLTPQELEIAKLAASGLTNKQIAQRLFLSHRTVGAHLYQVFPKLGVISRAALREALQSSRLRHTAGIYS